jgi:hypothetical protein
MQCRYCKAENPVHDGYCSSCGRRLSSAGPRKRRTNNVRPNASPLVRTALASGAGLPSTDPVFRPLKIVKGNHLTGSASTATFTKTPRTGAAAVADRERDSVRTDTGAVDGQGRSEPYLGSSGASPVDPAAEQQRRHAFYNQFNAPQPRSRPRFVYVIGVFAIGAVVGLSSAWWWRQPSLAALGKNLPRAAHSAQLPLTAHEGSRGIKGIDPRELPYDGLPPKSRMQAGQTQRSGINPEELPYAGLPSAESDSQLKPTPGSTSQGPQKPPATATENNMPHIASTAVVARSDADKAPKKHHSARRRIAKDREIERIKQQAAEELKKKTENRRLVAQREETSAHRSARPREAAVLADKFTRTRAQLASCEHARNFFLREKCKWHLCGDSWGKNGCPSYQMQAGGY